MKPVRISVTLPFAAAPASLEPAIPLFHEFMQQGLVEGLLIDVADYQHVPDGPGILLVGHDVDYAINDHGLTVVRKRQPDVDAARQLQDTLRIALAGRNAIEADGRLGIGFQGDGLEIAIFDRLRAPNTREGLQAVQALVAPVLSAALGEADLAAEAGDARDPVRIRVTLPAPLDVAATLEKLPAGAKPQIPYAAPQSDWDITAEQLKDLREGGSDFLLVDVREDDEFAKVNLDGKLVPLGTLGDRLTELPKDGHVVVHCKVGGRGAQAVKQLRDAGFENAWNLRGGILAWIDRIDPSLPRY